MPELIRIGTAGWAIPRHCTEHFPQDGSGLERYAARFTAVEINSTFRRSHKPHTYARWAQAVPEGFRFAVKMPKRISHELKLLGTGDSLRIFWEEVRELEPKLGPLLLQLPLSFNFPPRWFMTRLSRSLSLICCERASNTPLSASPAIPPGSMSRPIDS